MTVFIDNYKINSIFILLAIIIFNELIYMNIHFTGSYFNELITSVFILHGVIVFPELTNISIYFGYCYYF